MVKKRSEKSVEKEECCTMYGHHGCKVFLVKIASMAFILFLMTVWKGLGTALLSVHWGIYLGIVLLLIVVALLRCSKKK
jgi:hypothetical protein